MNTYPFLIVSIPLSSQGLVYHLELELLQIHCLLRLGVPQKCINCMGSHQQSIFLYFMCIIHLNEHFLFELGLKN